ncbi:MAG: DUF4349 domain-containing protein [Solirubrobacteraceae bacterium]
MSRRDDALDPGLEAELDQLEALFADDVRATAIRPDAAFRAALDRPVAGGFPRAQREWPAWVRWSPAVAVVAAALVALVVAFGSRDTSRTSDSLTRLSNDSGGSAASSPAAPESARASGGRSVERNATLTLRGGAEVQRAADGVVRATQGAGGYVQSSNVAVGARGRADFVLRIPSGQLATALAALSRLGHVQSLEQTTQDITSTVNAAAARLQEARAERRGLLRALANAAARNEVTAIRARLRDNRARLARAEREARAARGRAALSTVSVGVVGVRRSAVAPPADGPWSPGDALHDAGRVLEIGAGVAVVALAVALLLAIPAGLGLLGRRTVRRRRREAALEAG